VPPNRPIFNPKLWDPSNGAKSEGKRWVHVQKDEAKLQTLKSRGKTAVEVQSEGMDAIIPTIFGPKGGTRSPLVSSPVLHTRRALEHRRTAVRYGSGPPIWH
jgi:hypothetical protein